MEQRENLRLKVLTKPLWVEIETLPPSTNQIWRNNGAGRVYKVLEASRWENHLIVRTRKFAVEAYGTYNLSELKGAPLKLEIFVQRPTWHGKTKLSRHRYVRPDLSNFIKVAEDAVMGALDLDDSAVITLIAKKVEAPGAERTLICLTFLGGDES